MTQFCHSKTDLVEMIELIILNNLLGRRNGQVMGWENHGNFMGISWEKRGETNPNEKGWSYLSP